MVTPPLSRAFFSAYPRARGVTRRRDWRQTGARDRCGCGRVVGPDRRVAQPARPGGARSPDRRRHDPGGGRRPDLLGQRPAAFGDGGKGLASADAVRPGPRRAPRIAGGKRVAGRLRVGSPADGHRTDADDRTGTDGKRRVRRTIGERLAQRRPDPVRPSPLATPPPPPPAAPPAGRERSPGPGAATAGRPTPPPGP